MDDTAILCVDDEAIILMSLIQELKKNLGNRYIYEGALNAEKAFDILQDLKDDGIPVVLIISDWLMPGMKGDVFLIKVRKMYPSVKTIMITGMADDEAKRKVQSEAGVCAILDKPWNKNALMEAVNKACDG